MMKTCLALLIRLYQKVVSPYKPACCRYYPSCSSYALQAVRRFGALRGGIMAVWRILRCNPFCRGGIDPVPEVFTLRRARAAKKTGGGAY